MEQPIWGGFGKVLQRQKVSIEELTNLLLKVEQKDEHWIWTGKNNSYGYPKMWWRGKDEYVHRVFYAIFKGRIKFAYDIHHGCKVKNCVSPWHTQQKKHVDHTIKHNDEVPF